MDLFDFLPQEESAKYKPIKSTDWKWTMANDYPKEKNGLEVKEGIGEEAKCKNILEKARPTDKSIADILIREENRNSRFNEMVVWDNIICPTIHNHGFYRAEEKTKFTIQDYRNCQTFPQDYNWLNEQPAYICGMSVPPIMIKRIVTRLIESGIFKENENDNE